MPLARHDIVVKLQRLLIVVSTHMPLARHDKVDNLYNYVDAVSTHMPLARHDLVGGKHLIVAISFYSHASCEA